MSDVPAWVAPLLIPILGLLIRSWMADIKTAVGEVKTDVKALAGSVHTQDTRLALLESRTARNEGEIGTLHGRVSRLITDKLDAKGTG